MTGDQHDHSRPDTADMRTALAATRVLLQTADLGAAAQAAATGSCPACVAAAGISYGLTLASRALGDTGLMSERVRLALLDAVDATEAELDAAQNLAGAARRATMTVWPDPDAADPYRPTP